MELNLRNKQSRELLKNLEGAISLDFDVLRRKLFFSDVDEEKIYMYLPVLNTVNPLFSRALYFR